MANYTMNYVTLFVLTSLVVAAGSLPFMRLRPHLLRILVAPIAFGVSSTVPFVVLYLALIRRPVGQVMTIDWTLFVIAYLLSGTIGTLLALAVLEPIEKKLLSVSQRWVGASRIVTAFASFLVTFVLAYAPSWLTVREVYAMYLAMAGAGGVAFVTYLALRDLQTRRPV